MDREANVHLWCLGNAVPSQQYNISNIQFASLAFVLGLGNQRITGLAGHVNACGYLWWDFFYCCRKYRNIAHLRGNGQEGKNVSREGHSSFLPFLWSLHTRTSCSSRGHVNEDAVIVEDEEKGGVAILA